MPRRSSKKHPRDMNVLAASIVAQSTSQPIPDLSEPQKNPHTFLSEALYYGTSTSDGAADGSTLIDSGLSGYTADDQLIGYTVLILTSLWLLAVLEVRRAAKLGLRN
jgi:hypothetical protein